MTSPCLRRDFHGSRPIAAALIRLTAIAALMLDATMQQMAGDIEVACGVAAMGGLDAIMLLAKREADISSGPREQDHGARAAEHERMEAARRGGPRTDATARLAAGAAHDFNDILQAIISGLDLVMDEVEVGTPARESASMALNAAMRGSHVTHHLLAYAGNQMLRPEAIAVADFLSAMATLLCRTLDPHITVGLLVTDAPVMFADPTELQTALRNIAINAAQAMPRGGALRIDARKEVADGAAWISITMTDTGTGMDAATLARATEPFFTTKGGGAAGLGLSMAQGFAEQSGGTLRIASKPDGGTAVELRLPAAIRATDEAGQLATVNDGCGAGLHGMLR